MFGIRHTVDRLLSSLRRPATAGPALVVNTTSRTRPAAAAIPELAATIAAALGTPEKVPRRKPPAQPTSR